MGILSQKRSGLLLLTSPQYVESHRIRIITHEKMLDIDYIDIDPDKVPEDVLEINPTGSIPTLIDRELVLFDARVISEYIDERFPHPALMPIEADARAKIRLMLYQIEQHWYPYVNDLEHNRVSVPRRKKILKELRDNILLMTPFFKIAPFLLSDCLTLLDCGVLPVLWRLPALGIELPKEAQAIMNYMNRMFEREGFQASLSDYERGLRA